MTHAVRRILTPRGVGLLAAACMSICLAATGPVVARADTIAIVRDGSAYQATADGPDPFVEVDDDVASVAYDRDGRLWLAREPWSEDGSCSIEPADGLSPALSTGRIERRLRRRNIHIVHCSLTIDPRGGLLLEASNMTLGSSTVWHVDTASSVASYVSYGYSPSASSDARRIAVVQHVYRPTTGADERLAVGALGRPRSMKVLAPRGSQWSAPSFAPDGRLAAVHLTRRGSRLLIGDGRGLPRRTLWAPGRAIVIWATAWSPSGDLFVMAGRRMDDEPDLYRLRGGSPPLEGFTSDVTDFALGPDATSPPIAPSAPETEGL